MSLVIVLRPGEATTTNIRLRDPGAALGSTIDLEGTAAGLSSEFVLFLGSAIPIIAIDPSASSQAAQLVLSVALAGTTAATSSESALLKLALGIAEQDSAQSSQAAQAVVAVATQATDESLSDQAARAALALAMRAADAAAAAETGATAIVIAMAAANEATSTEAGTAALGLGLLGASSGTSSEGAIAAIAVAVIGETAGTSSSVAMLATGLALDASALAASSEAALLAIAIGAVAADAGQSGEAAVAAIATGVAAIAASSSAEQDALGSALGMRSTSAATSSQHGVLRLEIAMAALADAGSSQVANLPGALIEPPVQVQQGGGGGGGGGALRVRRPRSSHKAPATFSIECAAQAAITGGAQAGADLDSSGADNVQLVRGVHAAASFAADGGSRATLETAARADTVGGAGGDSLVAFSVAAIGGASVVAVASSVALFVSRARGAGALGSVGSSSVAFTGRASARSAFGIPGGSAALLVSCSTSRFVVPGELHIAADSDAEIVGAVEYATTQDVAADRFDAGDLQADAASASSFVAAAAATATIDMTGEGAAAFASSAMLATRWTADGDTEVLLASRAAATARLQIQGDSTMNLAGIEDGNLEATIRRIKDVFGVELGPKQPKRGRSDEAAPAAQLRRTATFVHNSLRAGHGTRRRQVPKPQWPWALERDYATDLVSIITALRRTTDAALADLPALIEDARREREDALDRELLGLHVVIENPAGSIRTWIDADGTTGQTVMRWSYGYLDGYEGVDGEDVDAYVGPELEPREVFVIHQRRKGSPDDAHWLEYDEDKVMLGWPSADAAKAAYLEQYDDPRFFGGMSVFTAADFKQRLIANPGRKLTHADPHARVLRVDVGEGRRARFLMDRARDGLTSSESKAEDAAGAVAGQVADFQKRQLGKQSAAALGVDITPLLHDPKKAAQIDAFVHENVALVKSLGSSTLHELEKIVTRSFADGKRAADVGAEIEKRWGIAERHARLIARDQIGKLNGQITRSRHEELGLAKFRWLTMRDPKVRPTHEPMEGKTFAYKGEDAPPFFPGQEVCCRCLEEPLFDDVMSLLDQLMAQPAAVPVDESQFGPQQRVRVPDTSALEHAEAQAVQYELERRAAASAAAVAATHEDLHAFDQHTAKEKAWAAKVAAAKEKQATALAELKAKLATEQAAKAAAEQAAHEAAKLAAEKAAAAAAAAKLAAEKAAEEAAAAAKKAKLSDAAKKGAATKKANKEAAAKQVVEAAKPPSPPPSLFTPPQLADYQTKIGALQSSANTTPPTSWSVEKYAAQAAAKDALALHSTVTTAPEMLKAADAFEAVAAKAQAAGSYWGAPYQELAQQLRDRVADVELEASRAARQAARAARAASPATPAKPIQYASMRPEAFSGFHGQAFVQDADAVEGGSVRVVRVQGTDGKEYYEALFKVTAPHGDQARKFGVRQADEWEFRARRLRNGVMVDQADTQTTPNKFRVRHDGTTTFEIGLDGALANQVRVRASSLAELDTAMGKFSTHLGANTQVEPTQADLELQAKARIAAKYDPKAFGSLMAKAKTSEDQHDAIETVFEAQAKKHPELHDIVQDAEVREVYPGHRTLYSETLGRKLAKEYGSIYHDGSPPASVAASIVGDTGLMSSAKRYHSGVFTTGMSTGTDFGSGGADGVFMRLSKSTPNDAGGKFRAVVDTAKVMGRMDWWAFNFDNYGTSSYGTTGHREGYSQRFSVPDMAKGSVQYGNEVMAPHGVPPSAFKKFIVEDESYRKQVLAELRKMGVTEINGKPAADFVTLR